MTATRGSAQAALLARILSDVPTDPTPPDETFPGADLLPRPSAGRPPARWMIPRPPRKRS